MKLRSRSSNAEQYTVQIDELTRRIQQADFEIDRLNAFLLEKTISYGVQTKTFNVNTLNKYYCYIGIFILVVSIVSILSYYYFSH